MEYLGQAATNGEAPETELSLYATPDTIFEGGIEGETPFVDPRNLTTLFSKLLRHPTGYKRENSLMVVTRGYTTDEAMTKCIEDRFLPTNMLDSFFFEIFHTKPSLFLYDYWWVARMEKVATASPVLYFNTLDRTADLETYLMLLSLYPAGGVVLNDRAYEDPSWKKQEWILDPSEYLPSPNVMVQNYTPAYTNSWQARLDGFENVFSLTTPRTPMNLFMEHRALYKEMCKRFGEVLLLRYIPVMHNILDYAHYENKDLLLQVYEGLLGRSLVDVPGMVKAVYKIRIIQEESGLLLRTVDSFIPNDRQFLNIVYADGTARSAQEAVLFEYEQALFMLMLNIQKLEARIAALSDPAYRKMSTAWSEDPLLNPLLVPDIEASVSADKMVYVDISQGAPGKLSERISVEAGPELKHYLEAPEWREKALRGLFYNYKGTIPTTTLKEFGLIPEGAIKDVMGKRNLLPYIIGGAAAGMLALQAG